MTKFILAKYTGIKCSINDDFWFDMEDKSIHAGNKSSWCMLEKGEGEAMEFIWPKNRENSILKRQHIIYRVLLTISTNSGDSDLYSCLTPKELN